MLERITLSDIHSRKRGEPIVVLTAYTAPVARILDPHVDILLVGDSLGMVVYGMNDTVDVTLDMMIAHGKAVVRASKRALVVVDMPYGTYEFSPEQALASAQRVMTETGAGAVKLEGGRDRAAIIRHLTQAGIAVMGHIGLLPQRVREMGGYRAQGRTQAEAEGLLADALALQEAGVFSMVIEATQEDVARRLTEAVSVPTIGIGASVACDGQVLVVDDIFGLSPLIPRFAKVYADITTAMSGAAERYAAEVRARQFPSEGFLFRPKI
jgi:3-methyl-2-oxobutanoate hydroxymethyltransferase